MSDVGTHIALSSRSLVRPPVDERMSPRTPDPAFGAAGAHKPEPDPPEGVAAVPLFVDPESHSAYGDAVREHQGEALKIRVPRLGILWSPVYRGVVIFGRFIGWTSTRYKMRGW